MDPESVIVRIECPSCALATDVPLTRWEEAVNRHNDLKHDGLHTARLVRVDL